MKQQIGNKQLFLDGDDVYSYTTHVATIDRAAGVLYYHGHWSATTTKHINLVAKMFGLKTVESKRPEQEPNSMLKTVGTIAALAELFYDNLEEKNDWKARMLKAGVTGLSMPENWNELSEDEKQSRLDKVIAFSQEQVA